MPLVVVVFMYLSKSYTVTLPLDESCVDEFITILLPSANFVVAHIVFAEKGWEVKTVEPVNPRAVYERQDVVYVCSEVS